MISVIDTSNDNLHHFRLLNIRLGANMEVVKSRFLLRIHCFYVMLNNVTLLYCILNL